MPFLKPAVLDPVIKDYSNIIESFTYVTYNLEALVDPDITNSYASDTARINTIDNTLFGVTPSFFNVTGYDFTDFKYRNVSSGLNLIE